MVLSKMLLHDDSTGSIAVTLRRGFSQVRGHRSHELEEMRFPRRRHQEADSVGVVKGGTSQAAPKGGNWGVPLRPSPAGVGFHGERHMLVISALAQTLGCEYNMTV